MDSPMDSQVKPFLILGVGNPMFGDDGFGVECIRRLADLPGFEEVEILDGGTSGIYLLPHFEGRSHVWIVDAVHFRGTPGTVIELPAEQVAARLNNVKLSEHQVTLNEVLALLDLLEARPPFIKLIGVQPEHMRFAGGLSDTVAARLPEVIDILRREVSHAANECAVPA